jgi:hypothetical protein
MVEMWNLWQMFPLFLKSKCLVFRFSMNFSEYLLFIKLFLHHHVFIRGNCCYVMYLLVDFPFELNSTKADAGAAG